MSGPNVTVSHAPKLYLKLAGGLDVGEQFIKFEWAAFVNGGFVVRAELSDPYWEIVKKFVTTQEFLDQGRRIPTPIEFELSWRGTPQKTGIHLGYLTDIDITGTNAGGAFTFVCVDPPTWWLNAGDCSGDAYKGNVKEVIEQVLNKYFVGPNGGGDIKVSDTVDNKSNIWWQMRQDPKTFIASMIDWSSSITQKKTNFMVSSDGNLKTKGDIHIVEQAVKESQFYGTYLYNINTPEGNDAIQFQFLADTYISVFQKQLITSGISSVSERFFDRITDKPREIVHVYDERTSTKKNVEIDKKHGFAKPGADPRSIEKPHEWSTSISAIPQHNAGDMGLSYDKYIDGRARTQYLDMLKHVMRMKLTVTGDPSEKLATTHNLGVSKLKVAWKDADDESVFLDGDWLVYGFHHKVSRGKWTTDLYVNRLDYNAAAEKV